MSGHPLFFSAFHSQAGELTSRVDEEDHYGRSAS